MAKYLGNFILGFNQLERRTVSPPASNYSNGSLFKGTTATPTLVATAADIDNTLLGILLVEPAGVTIVNGDSIDLTCGTIRLDIQAYESARLDEIDKKGSSTMCDLSSLLIDPVRNDAISGNGCILELVQVVR